MRPTPITERMQKILLAQWQELLRLRMEVLKTSDSEAIHDLRVASRRFRAVVGLFEPWVKPKRSALLKTNCRLLTRKIGALRNIDEALIFFQRRVPATSGGGYQILRLLAKQRAQEQHQINKVLTAMDHRHLDRIVRKVALDIEERLEIAGSIQSGFSDTFTKLFQPIRDLAPTVTLPEQRNARHALRIAIKKLRYFFEIASPVLEYNCDSSLALFKEYQTILGRMNDIAEFGLLCDHMNLSRHERTFVETVLQSEDQLQLQKFTKIMARKPLGSIYPFEPDKPSV